MLCIDDRILNLEELEELTREKDEVDFQQFKKMIIALFGDNLFKFDLVIVDTVLRQVYFALYVPDDQEEQELAEKMARGKDQACKVTYRARVTDENMDALHELKHQSIP